MWQEIRPEDLIRMLQGGGPKVKKPPVKIAELTPEDKAKNELMYAKAKGMMKSILKLQRTIQHERDSMWFELATKYDLFGKDVHIHNGVIYQGREDETEHIDKNDFPD